MRSRKLIARSHLRFILIKIRARRHKKLSKSYLRLTSASRRKINEPCMIDTETRKSSCVHNKERAKIHFKDSIQTTFWDRCSNKCQAREVEGSHLNSQVFLEECHKGGGGKLEGLRLIYLIICSEEEWVEACVEEEWALEGLVWASHFPHMDLGDSHSHIHRAALVRDVSIKRKHVIVSMPMVRKGGEIQDKVPKSLTQAKCSQTFVKDFAKTAATYCFWHKFSQEWSHLSCTI